MKKLWFIMIIALAFLVTGVNAQFVSFADPDSTVHKDMYIYNATGSLLGVYNTTSSAIDITGAGDVIFVLKPQYSNPLDDPGTWLNGLVSWFATNATTMFLIGVIAYLVFRRS